MPIKNDYMLKNVGNEYMIIPTSNTNVNFSKIFNINETAAFIFKNLQEERSKEEILELMLVEYDAPKEVLSADIDDFIKELKKRGIYHD